LWRDNRRTRFVYLESAGLNPFAQTRTHNASPATQRRCAGPTCGALRGDARQAARQALRRLGHVWTERISPGSGQPPELAIRADVEIPERQLGMRWMLRRNTDPSLPASHTIEIMFKLPNDFDAGGISNVPGIMMKQPRKSGGLTRRPRGESHEWLFPDWALIGGHRQGAKHHAAQGAVLIRYSGPLQQRSPRHSGPRKRRVG
jgi:hypothetical protein